MGDVGLMLLVGGHPAIDLVNTLGGRPDTPDDEYLHGYTDLLVWCRRTGLVKDTQAQRLTAAVADHPNEADATLPAVLQLRAAVDAVLRARLAQRAPRGEDLDTVRRSYASAVHHAQLHLDDAGCQWNWPASHASDLRAPPGMIALTAFHLLDRARLDQLGQCGHCRWLFLDTSRNHTRRWCSMNACGAVLKMRRHRTKKAALTQP